MNLIEVSNLILNIEWIIILTHVKIKIGHGINEKVMIETLGKWDHEEKKLFRKRSSHYFSEDERSFERWEEHGMRLLKHEFMRFKVSFFFFFLLSFKKICVNHFVFLLISFFSMYFPLKKLITWYSKILKKKLKYNTVWVFIFWLL